MRLKAIMFLLILGIVPNMYGQSRFSLVISPSYLMNDRIITSYESNLYKNYRDNNEGILHSFDISVLMNYKISDKIIFETGIGYMRNGYSTKEDQLIDPGFSPTTEGFYSELYRFVFRNIYIPAHFEYSFGPKSKLSISLGPSLLLPVSESIQYILRKDYNSIIGQKIILMEDAPQISNINLAFDIGFGVRYNISKSIGLVIQPKLSYFLFGQENTWLKDRKYNIGRFIDVDKATKEHLYCLGIGIKVRIK